MHIPNVLTCIVISYIIVTYNNTFRGGAAVAQLAVDTFWYT